MLIQIILHAGQASPTHTFVCLDRCDIKKGHIMDEFTPHPLDSLQSSLPLSLPCFPCRYRDCLYKLCRDEDLGEANEVGHGTLSQNTGFE